MKMKMKNLILIILTLFFLKGCDGKGKCYITNEFEFPETVTYSYTEVGKDTTIIYNGEYTEVCYAPGADTKGDVEEVLNEY